MTKEPTALSGEIVNKFSAIVDSLSQRVGADPRKARAMTDAKGRMNELYEKLKTGQYADELEALLHEFAVALETENKANVTRVCSLACLRIALGDLLSSIVSHFVSLHVSRCTRCWLARTGKTWGAR